MRVKVKELAWSCPQVSRVKAQHQNSTFPEAAVAAEATFRVTWGPPSQLHLRMDPLLTTIPNILMGALCPTGEIHTAQPRPQPQPTTLTKVIPKYKMPSSRPQFTHMAFRVAPEARSVVIFTKSKGWTLTSSR